MTHKECACVAPVLVPVDQQVPTRRIQNHYSLRPKDALNFYPKSTTLDLIGTQAHQQLHQAVNSDPVAVLEPYLQQSPENPRSAPHTACLQLLVVGAATAQLENIPWICLCRCLILLGLGPAVERFD